LTDRGSAPPTIVVVMGVAGAGKSTLASALADHLGVRFLEGDDLHPGANVAKMRNGVPLSDADRWPWLSAIAAWIDERAVAMEPAVVACSTLKRSYRKVLGEGRPYVRFVHVAGPPKLVAERMAKRQGHYFPASLITSQFEALEPPLADEKAIVVDMALPVAAQVADVVAELRL
jgi:gluconokinase